VFRKVRLIDGDQKETEGSLAAIIRITPYSERYGGIELFVGRGGRGRHTKVGRKRNKEPLR